MLGKDISDYIDLYNLHEHKVTFSNANNTIIFYNEQNDDMFVVDLSNGRFKHTGRFDLD